MRHKFLKCVYLEPKKFTQYLQTVFILKLFFVKNYTGCILNKHIPGNREEIKRNKSNTFMQYYLRKNNEITYSDIFLFFLIDKIMQEEISELFLSLLEYLDLIAHFNIYLSTSFQKLKI